MRASNGAEVGKFMERMSESPATGCDRADSLFLHRLFYFIGCVRQVLRKVHQFSALVHVERVFDAYTEIFLRDVDSGFNCEYFSGREWFVEWSGIVHIESDAMAESVNEVLA